MTQEEKWLVRYNEVRGFIEENKRNPSKYRIEEHDMLNWVKQQRKLVKAGELRPERMEKFKVLIALGEQFKRKNQYE